jgi:uncharacterized membrane protein YagU involved in acid resistance
MQYPFSFDFKCHGWRLSRLLLHIFRLLCFSFFFNLVQDAVQLLNLLMHLLFKLIVFFFIVFLMLPLSQGLGSTKAFLKNLLGSLSAHF